MCIYPFFNSPREHYDCLIATVVHLTLAVVLTFFFGWPALLLTLIIPHLVASAIGSYLFYAQHNFPGVSFYDRAGWAYEKAALESSSFLKTGPVMGLVHRQHRLSSHPSPQRPRPVLPPAGSSEGNPRTCQTQDHFAARGGHHPLSALESLGCGSATDDRFAENLTRSKTRPMPPENQFLKPNFRVLAALPITPSAQLITP